MLKNTFIFILITSLNKITAQNIHSISTTPDSIQDPNANASWENLLPSLKMIKSTPNMKKERLLDVVRVIQFLLSDENEKNEYDKILEEIQEADESQKSVLPDTETIGNVKSIPIAEPNDSKDCKSNDINLQKNVIQNKPDFSKILAKISTALDKINEHNEKLKQDNSPLMGMFRSKDNICKNNNSPPLFETLGQSPKQQSTQFERNLMKQETKFSIPCQRASDILKETSSFVFPKGAYCDLPINLNLNSILKDPKLNPDNLPFKVVPNSVSCVDGKDSVAILFKPKKISMSQVYGNLLKKITVTGMILVRRLDEVPRNCLIRTTKLYV